MRPEDMFLPERAAPWPQLFKRALAEGPFRIEHPLLDGHTLEMAINPIIADGEAMGVSVFGKDITKRKLAEMELRDSEERYRATFEQAAVGIVHVSFDGRYLRCNTRFAEIVGYAQEEIPGMTFQQITLPEDQAKCETARQQIASGAIEGASLEKRYLRKDGSLIWVKLTCSTQRDAEGRALHNIAIVEDINARKTVEESLTAAQGALRLSEERYHTAFQTCLDSIAIKRLRDGIYIDANQAFLDNLGFEREEIIGRTPLELGIWVDDRDSQKIEEMLHQDSICRGLEARFRRKNREIFWGHISASVFESDGVPCILSITRDISDAKLAEEEIRNLAFYDPLTALPNRRLLLERLRQTLAVSVRSGRSQALLSIDLDDFKTLNDTLGHQKGDLVLQEAARRIAACVRAADTMGRLSGDEFVVMLEDLSEVPEEAAAQAKSVGEKILASVGNLYLIEGRECRSTCSIGIAVFGGRRISTDEILQQADIALHQAKAAGRNTIRFFSPALQVAVNARAAMEDDLRQAIKTNQFLLYYQPQVEWGRLTGAEALIRWRHPTRGILPPNEFIHLAEESRLILPVGDWVLETACAQIASWAGRKRTADVTIAVNISTLQFRQPEFAEQVLAALDRTGANPENLKLELTESMLERNNEDIIAKMTELKSHGLRFSLDDFGTGYSSLARLKRFPLDELKIDRAFVRDILEDSTSGAIAQTIISLGRAMRMSVIAEGVETEEQRSFLAGLGCHSFQGYLFSQPLPLEEFETYLQNFAESCAPLRGSWESYARGIETKEPILSRSAIGGDAVPKTG
jgi:diguanylate cyclase (GGDEF)-like protein/PAS domain S-box-containing protein